MQDNNSISISLGGGREISLCSREFELPLDTCSLQCDFKQYDKHNLPANTLGSPKISMKSKYLVDTVTKEDALLGIEKVIQYIKYVRVQPSLHQKDINFLWNIHERITRDTIVDVDDEGSNIEDNFINNGTLISLHEPSLVDIPFDESSQRYTRANNDENIHVANDEQIDVETTIRTAATKRTPVGRKFRGSSWKKKCSMCNKKFTNGSMLAAHMRMHVGLQPYQCSICSKVYCSITGYKKHMILHSGKLFQCEKCGKNFKTPDNLYSHMRTHDEVKKYVCPICGKRSTLSCHNLQHMKTHTNDRQHICGACGKAFIGSYDLLRHNRRVHSY